jgi:hypothetical protein
MYKYHFLKILNILFGVLFPVINIIDIEGNEFFTRITSAIFGSIIVGITGLLQLIKAKESWILYRSTVEALDPKGCRFIT